MLGNFALGLFVAVTFMALGLAVELSASTLLWTVALGPFGLAILQEAIYFVADRVAAQATWIHWKEILMIATPGPLLSVVIYRITT